MAITQRKNDSWAVCYPFNGKLKWEYYGMGITGEKKAQERNEELKQLGVIGKYTRQKSHVESPLFQTLHMSIPRQNPLGYPKHPLII